MKPSKEVSDRPWKYDLKVVLPRIKLTMSKSQPKSCFKRKRPRRGRSSAWSDKENDNLANVVHSKQNLSLIQIEKSLTSDKRDGHLDLSATDLKLVGDVLNKRETRSTEYLRVALHRIDSSKTFNGNVHYSKSTGTLSEISNVEVGISTSKHQKKKTKKEKCSRKDSGIGIESPKAKTTKKRKLSSHLDYQSDDTQENTIDSSENEVRGLADIIQLYSSHTFSNKVDQKINNVGTVRTSKELYVHRNFEIRITQLCTDQPSQNSTSTCSTSVVASTTRSENIEKSAIKECRNVAVEKKIGINTRVTVGDRKKNCTRIVESKLVETTEQRHKRIKLDEPSGMVTRRKAAINLEYKFYTLTNEKYCSVVESSNIANKRSDQLKHMQENGINQKKKSTPSKKVLPVEKKHDISNKKSKKDEPKSLYSKSFQSSSEGKEKKAETFKNIATNPEAINGFNKILKDVTLDRVENTELWTGHVIQKFEHSIEKKTRQERRGRPKKIKDINQTTNKPVHEAEVIAGTNQLQNSTKTKKLLNNKENSSSSKVKPASKESNNSSAAEAIPEVLLSKEKKQDLKSSARPKGHKCNQQMKNNELRLPKERLNSSNDSSTVEVISPRPGCSGVSLPKGKKHDLKPSAKIKDRESKQQMTDDEVKLPKNRSNLPAKKLMKKSEALEKAERYNKKKKVLINGDTTILSSTISVLLEDVEDAALPRRVTRFSSKTQNTSLVASKSKLETARGTPCVTFSSKTPKTISHEDNDNRNNWNPSFTPCILLDRLDASDISTYAITPLREDRRPLAPKSTEDYGIDDVNTDDSTDEEENPKKRVPNWVNSVGYNSKVQFYFPRDVILSWIRPPKKKFTIQNLFT